jgi:L-lactate dehydrogenase complex protein LldG
MSAREDILTGLRAALAHGKPFPGAEPAAAQAVTRIDPGEDLVARFIAEVQRVKGEVHTAANDDEALDITKDLLTSHHVRRVVMWDEAHLPLRGVWALLERLGIERVYGDNTSVAAAEAGITGADWALAATGTLVLSSGPGRPRMASLLPPLHIALLTEDRLIPRLEDYLAAQRVTHFGVFRRSSNVTLITGSSRTSDIELHPVFGVHGPLALHVVLIRNLNGRI